MRVVLYSTKCPKCNVLEKKLTAAGVEYAVSYDVNEMAKKGFRSAPILEVDGELKPFKDALNWLKNRGSDE